MFIVLYMLSKSTISHTQHSNAIYLITQLYCHAHTYTLIELLFKANYIDTGNNTIDTRNVSFMYINPSI